jgi:hypothetical protein
VSPEASRSTKNRRFEPISSRDIDERAAAMQRR